MMGLVKLLLEEIESSIKFESSISVDCFPDDLVLEASQSVDWVSSTYHESTMNYIYKVSEEGSRAVFISSSHSDGGVTVFSGGPWDSLDEAESSFGAVSETWTRN